MRVLVPNRNSAALSRLARVLRAGAYAAILALTVAKASVEQVAYSPAVVPRLANPDASVPALDGMIFTWLAAYPNDPVSVMMSFPERIVRCRPPQILVY